MEKLNQKQKIEIRSPKMSDLDSLLSMINSLVDEKAMITVQNKLTRKEEEKYLKGIIKDKNAIHLFLLINGEVVGSARVAKYENIKSHIGEFGISIRKEGRGLGLGKKLLNATIEKAIKQFKLKIIVLDVFKNNKIAQNLYKKAGFKQVGMIKDGAKYFEKYEDSIIMAKYLV